MKVWITYREIALRQTGNKAYLHCGTAMRLPDCTAIVAIER